jgi:uncharacterized membrane protein YidH (DUF202 family)
MKTLGIILIVLSLAALAYGGFRYQTRRTIVDVGPIQATATENHGFPISPVVSVIALVAGVLLVVTPRRRME